MLMIKPKELEKLTSAIGLNKNELASVLNVTRSTLWRWLQTGEIPERAYVFLSTVRYELTPLGLRKVKFINLDFEDEVLNKHSEEIRKEFLSEISNNSKPFFEHDIQSIDSSELLEEIKRRNPNEQVIIARVKSLN